MRTIVLTVAAATIAFIIDLALGAAAVRLTRVPPDFPPFTLLPIQSGAVGGALLENRCQSRFMRPSPALQVGETLIQLANRPPKSLDALGEVGPAMDLRRPTSCILCKSICRSNRHECLRQRNGTRLAEVASASEHPREARGGVTDDNATSCD